MLRQAPAGLAWACPGQQVQDLVPLHVRVGCGEHHKRQGKTGRWGLLFFDSQFDSTLKDSFLQLRVKLLLYFCCEVRGRLIIFGVGGTSRTLNFWRTLNYFRGPGAPRGRLIPRTLKCFDFAFIFISKFKAFRAQRGAKVFDFAFNFLRKFKAFRAQRGAKSFLLCSRGQGVPRGRLIFGGRLIVSGVRGHLADA